VRRLLVEAAWHHRSRYGSGRPCATDGSWHQQPPAAARSRGDHGDHRLHQRWVRFIERRKRPTIASVAIARELAGWCWFLTVHEE
jgi:hypothetical protein